MKEERKYQLIVIGSSAGGIYALISLLEKLPSAYALPVIIVQHRTKEANDLFEEILQQKCRLRVKQADEKEKIVAGVVYTAPPNYHLLVEKTGHFSLSADEPVKFSRPSIDVLFETAADAFKEQLAGILLTGANSDGAQGILAIKQRGGTTIAQDPGEAQYTTMPAAAIEAGGVDLILKLADIKEFMLFAEQGVGKGIKMGKQ